MLCLWSYAGSLNDVEGSLISMSSNHDLKCLVDRGPDVFNIKIALRVIGLNCELCCLMLLVHVLFKTDLEMRGSLCVAAALHISIDGFGLRLELLDGLTDHQSHFVVNIPTITVQKFSLQLIFDLSIWLLSHSWVLKLQS